MYCNNEKQYLVKNVDELPLCHSVCLILLLKCPAWLVNQLVKNHQLLKINCNMQVMSKKIK